MSTGRPKKYQPGAQDWEAWRRPQVGPATVAPCHSPPRRAPGNRREPPRDWHRTTNQEIARPLRDG